MESSPALRVLLTFLLKTMIVACMGIAQLHPTDLAALKELRSHLHDLPGSFFFATWDFQREPCNDFMGVVCESFLGDNRISILNLGIGYAGTPGLMGSLSPSVRNLTFLTQLTLSPGKVTGEIPATLGELKLLNFIGISNNLLTGDIPASLGSLINLQVLDLSNNLLTGSIPQQVGRLPGLIAMTLSHNKLTGPIPNFTAGILQHLDLGGNTLSGELPSISNSLQYLSLDGNKLSGTLDRLASLRNLTFVDLSFNYFTGNVPIDLLQLHMSALFLQRNLLSGDAQPSRPVWIKTVDLSYNRLSGELSPFFAWAQNLYINNNNLSGMVPQKFLESLLEGSLQMLYLQHNYFTGFQINPDEVLPPESSFCIQYNCMLPPVQSTCPAKCGKIISRPVQQCHDHIAGRIG
ncbi:hypothetical protein O6H91_01G166100 [Diphasiastrum complanatum]|uniref:Uncharacterized protein n=1 Tax=Diphasiastrum complanatum TaxID=34168 RepID=A0ACC2EYE4_DIPCM|nr:hypothetical protein O6H91_Y495100 [Diphasiastrum complanatum]KAJ7571543.1 hypothetical protein O6H91_01G166100 [Diphasiastrum complanatum]